MYFNELNKIEFAVTYACTGKCRHCSEGDHASCGENISPAVAESVVRSVAAEYNIGTVMAFGGEPLLYPHTVYAIMNAAREMNVQKRQVITNGYFSHKHEDIDAVAKGLKLCGVNDLLVSVDAFHQEYIPLEAVMRFVSAALKEGVPVKIQPAWLVSVEDDNPYNVKTRELISHFTRLGVCENEGNVIFPQGNALKYLSEYFGDDAPENPYAEDPYNVKCVSVAPDGSVLGGNVYQKDILKIIKEYAP